MKKYVSGLAIVGLAFLAACSSQNNNDSGSALPSEIAAGQGEKQVSGYVFHDANSNHKRDNKEPGIAGVAVSNGREVVVTDEDGYYALPVSEDAPIFVIKPKNWMTPVNEQNLPQFSYIHKPGGSPDHYRYRGVEPTGDLPGEINFPLYKTQEGNEFKMLVFGDPQPYSLQDVDFLAEDIVRELTGRTDLAFGMTMGDIVGDSLNYFPAINQTVKHVGIPWYNVIGNHDHNYQAPNDKLADETFERVYGPATYAFEYGPAHFIVLDDIIHESKVGSHSYVGGFRNDQLTFVENYLKTVGKDQLVVLTMHIPFAKKGNSFRQEDQEKLFALLKDYPNTLSISAHTHVQNNWFFDSDSTNWHGDKPHHHFNVGTTSGSWWNGLKGENNIPHTMMSDGTPNGYAFITITGNDYAIDWKVAGSSPDHRMNIHVPRPVLADSDKNPLLTVNFFNGSKQSQVEYKVQEITDWKKMTRVEKVDPYYGRIHQRWNYLKELGTLDKMRSPEAPREFAVSDWDMPGPIPSSHLWEAELPTNLPAGSHTVEVRVKDRYGRTFTDYQILRVKGAE
jgi:hypothetical protein